VKRTNVGIWKCRACKKVIAGGAWTVSTTAAATVRRLVVPFHLPVMRPTNAPQHCASTERAHRSMNNITFCYSCDSPSYRYMLVQSHDHQFMVLRYFHQDVFYIPCWHWPLIIHWIEHLIVDPPHLIHLRRYSRQKSVQ